MLARCESSRAFPVEGAEVRRVGRQRDMWRASCLKASVDEGVGIRDVEGEGVVDDFKSKTPCTLAMYGLEGC